MGVQKGTGLVTWSTS